MTSTSSFSRSKARREGRRLLVAHGSSWIQVPDEAIGDVCTIYAIAFMDDVSCFIMHHRLMCEKRSDACAAVLIAACQVWAPSCVLANDNGGKFMSAAFVSLLREHGATLWRTARHIPEQKGDMERFPGPPKG
jgi:transposase InsO family protein